jgi:hypothetical protein
MADIYGNEGDVFDFLAMVEDESVDGVLTDFPYPTTERYRAIGTKTRTKDSEASSNPWYGVMRLEDLSRVLDELYRVLKPDSYAFIYVDEDAKVLLQYMRGVTADLFEVNRLFLEDGKASSRAPYDSVGFGWRNPTTWVKTTKDSGLLQLWFDKLYGRLIEAYDGLTPPSAKWNGYQALKLNPGTGYHGARCSAQILCLQKGNAQPIVRWNNVLHAPKPPVKPKGATMKSASPKSIYIAEVLTRAMSAPGGTILDPFVGSGTHAVGITNAGCDAIINDVSSDLYLDHLGNAYGREVIAW